MAPKREYSSLEQTFIGAASGTIEAAASQPTVAIKNAVQEGRPIQFNPRFMYTGLTVNAASIAPITAVQFGANRALAPLFADKSGELSPVMKIATSGAAGMISSLVSAPAELVMIQQQRTGASLGATFKSLVSTKGPAVLYRGLTMTAMREGLYVSFVLGTTPVLTQQLEPAVGSPSLAFTLAGLASGIGAAVMTHPFDTMKTFVQGNALEPKQLSSAEVASTVNSRGGLSAFYKGFAARGVRLVGAIFILNGSKYYFEKALDWYKASGDATTAVSQQAVECEKAAPAKQT